MTPNTNTANTSRGSERPAIPSVPTISSTTMPTPTYTHTYTPYFVSSRTFNRHPNPNSGPNSMVYGDLNLNLNDHPNSFNSNLSSSSTSISGLSRVDSSWAYPYSYNSNSVPHLYRADERKPGMKDMDVGNNSKSSTSGQEGYSQVVQATPSTRPRARKRAFHSSMDVDNDRNNTNITTNRKRTRGEHDYDGDAADTRPTARLSRHVSQSTAGPSSKADTVPVERIPKTPVPIRNPNSNPKLPSRTTKLKPSNPNLHVRASRTTEDLQPNEALTAVKPALYSHQPEVPKVIPVSDMGNDTRFRGRGRGTGGGLRFRGGRKISNHWNQHRRSKQARMGTSNRDGFFGNDSTPSTAASSGSMPTRPTPPTPHRLPSAVINKTLINNQPATNSLSVSDHDTEQRPRRDFTHLLPTKIRNRNMKRKTVDESEESGEVQVGEHEPGNAEGGVEEIIGNERVKSEPADLRLSPSESPTTTSRDPTQAPVFSQPHIKSEPPDLDVIPSSSTPDANQTSGTKRYHPIPAACLKHISASDKIVPNPHFRTARAEFSRRAVDELQREGLKVMRILWRPDGMCVDWERRKSVGGDAKPSLGSVRNIGKGKQREILETERNENLIDQLAAARGAILYSMEDEDELVLVQNESSPPQTAISSHSPDVAPLAQESPSSSPPCTAIPSPAQKQVEPRPPQLIDSEHNVNPHTGIDEVNLLLQSFEVLRRTLIAIKNESSPIHNDPSSLTTADPPLHSLPSSPPVLAISPPASRPSPTPSPSPMKLQESNFDFGTRGDADMIIDLTQDDVEPARIDSTASYAHPRPPDNSPPADDDSQPRSRYDPPLLVRLGSGSRSVGPSSLRPQTQTQNIQETHGQPASGAFTNSSSLISSYLDNTASTNKITPMPTPSPPHLSDPRLDTAGPSSRDLHSVESKSKVVPMPHPLTPTHTPPPPTSMFDFHDISTVVIVGDIEDVEDETGRKKSGTSTRGKRGAMMVTQLERPPQLKDEVQSRESQTRMGDSDPLDVCQAIDEDGDIGHPPVQPSDDDFRSSSYERNSSSPIQSIWFVDPSANNSNVQPIARGKEVVDQSRNQIEMNEVASGMKGYDVNVENDVEGEMEADSMDEKSEMEALAVEFLRRYINAWEYNRHSLVNAYAPSAVFSCSVIVPNTIPSTSSSSNSRASPSNSSSRSTPNLSPTLEFASHFVTSTALSSSFPSSSSSGIYSTSRTLNRPPLPIQTPAVISPALLLLDPQRLYTFFPRGEKAEIAYDSLWLGEAGAGGGLVYLGVQAELDRQTRTLANVNMNGEKVCISWNFVLRRTFMDDIEHGGGSGNAQGSEDDEIQFPLLVVSHQMVVRDTC